MNKGVGNKQTDFICPKCGNAFRPFQNGYRCSNKKCTFWIPRQIRQRALNQDSIQELITKKETGIIHGFHKRGYSQTFSARLYISDEWKIKFRLADDTDQICPRCNNSLMQFDRGYKCIDEDICGYILWNQFGGKLLTDEELKTILREKRTALIKGFISRKNGKKYNARIVMDDKGALRFEFDDTRKKQTSQENH